MNGLFRRFATSWPTVVLPVPMKPVRMRTLIGGLRLRGGASSSPFAAEPARPSVPMGPQLLCRRQVGACASQDPRRQEDEQVFAAGALAGVAEQPAEARNILEEG